MTEQTPARRAAEEIGRDYAVHRDRCHSNERYPSPPCDCEALSEITTIIAKHLPQPSNSAREQAPSDLIAFKWAESLSQGEQSTMLTSSIRRLQNAINAAIDAARERALEDAETLIGSELLVNPNNWNNRAISIVRSLKGRL